MRYILVSYKIGSGFMRDFKVHETSSDRMRLYYIAESERFKEMIKHGYSISIFEEVIKF